MGTCLHGIFSSENLDSSGEKVLLEGLDISSMVRDGVCNYEHKKDLPSQIVGKIKYVKKIFSEKDCENEHQLKFWSKIEIPYLYGIVELFDTEGHPEALSLVSHLRYDQKQERPESEKNLINFSIDGSKINVEGNCVKNSIGRDISLTHKACNKTCQGEELPKVSIVSPLDAIKTLFKNENNEGEVLSELDSKIIHLEALLKSDDISEFAKAKITEHLAKVKPQAGKVAPIQKVVNGRPSANLDRKPILPPKESLPWVPKASIAPRPKTTEANPKGIAGNASKTQKVPVIGANEFKQKIQAFKEKAAKQNAEVKDIYSGAPKSPVQTPKTVAPTVAPKIEAPKTAAPTAPKTESANGEPKTVAPTHFEVKSKAPKLDAIRAKTGPIMVPMSKAETAGTIVGPGSNTGFAALAGSDLKKQTDDIYKNWDKKEDFEKFLSSKLPKLSKNEIKALAKMYSVATMQKKEDILKDI